MGVSTSFLTPCHSSCHTFLSQPSHPLADFLAAIEPLMLAPLPRVWDHVEGGLAEPIRATISHGHPHTVGGDASLAALREARVELEERVTRDVMRPLDQWHAALGLVEVGDPGEVEGQGVVKRHVFTMGTARGVALLALQCTRPFHHIPALTCTCGLRIAPSTPQPPQERLPELDRLRKKVGKRSARIDKLHGSSLPTSATFRKHQRSKTGGGGGVGRMFANMCSSGGGTRVRGDDSSDFSSSDEEGRGGYLDQYSRVQTAREDEEMKRAYRARRLEGGCDQGWHITCCLLCCMPRVCFAGYKAAGLGGGGSKC
jgi:hypothetical protein